jgi:hypothetical protein
VVSYIWQKNKSLVVKDTVRYLWPWNCLYSFLFFYFLLKLEVLYPWQPSSSQQPRFLMLRIHTAGAKCCCYWLLLISWSVRVFRGNAASREYRVTRTHYNAISLNFDGAGFDSASGNSLFWIKLVIFFLSSCWMVGRHLKASSLPVYSLGLGILLFIVTSLLDEKLCIGVKVSFF